MTTASPRLSIEQLRSVLHDISPLIWRRVLVPSKTTLAPLHTVLQSLFAWSDEHRGLSMISGDVLPQGRAASGHGTAPPLQKGEQTDNCIALALPEHSKKRGTAYGRGGAEARGESTSRRENAGGKWPKVGRAAPVLPTYRQAAARRGECTLRVGLAVLGVPGDLWCAWPGA